MKPFISQSVQLFRPHSSNRNQPEAATITFVHGDGLVNVAAWDANGYSILGVTSVYYRENNEALPDHVTTYVQPVSGESSDSKEG